MKQKILFLLLSFNFFRQEQQIREQKEKDLEKKISMYPYLEDNSSSISSTTKSEAPPHAAAATSCAQCGSLEIEESCGNSVSIDQDCFTCFTTEAWYENCHKFYQNEIPACGQQNLNHQTEGNTDFENAETTKADALSQSKQIVQDQERDLCQNCFQRSFQEESGTCSCSKGTFDPRDEGTYHFCGMNQNSCKQSVFNQKRAECDIRIQILENQ